MKTSEVRKRFTNFFINKDHTFVKGSSTIPLGDQTILFTIAGMAQFKAALTGEETRPYKRATNWQKCIRIGDLDDVGKDGRHCTMFEMLGSWSFGDYFKKEAIEWAYEFVQHELKFDMAKVWVSVYEKDNEAAELWKDAGQPAERIVKLGDKDNFWAMGPTGPCGPCTELYYDQGEAVGKCQVKGFDCKAGPGCDCDRYLEFWNLVFMQYDRKEDGTLLELPFKSIDTGSGLERVAALLQGKSSAFDIDSFCQIKETICSAIGIDKCLATAPDDKKIEESLNVIADHIRTLTFTLADGCNFAAEGRGYVLRRVLRRAVRHAYKLNPKLSKQEGFLWKIVPTVVALFGEYYAELTEQQERVQNLLKNEELRFVSTLEAGLTKFTELAREARSKNNGVLLGEQVFLLHDSFGFPWDLTKVLCEENGISADLKGFQSFMELQKQKSRAEAKFYKFEQDNSPWIEFLPANQELEKLFVGYGIETSTNFKDGFEVHEQQIASGKVKRVRQLQNHMFELVIEETPFYPEGGGQLADSGWIVATTKHSSQEFEVIDVRKTPGCIIHLLRHGEFSNPESLRLTDAQLADMFGPHANILALINVTDRMNSARHHTATHLVHRALQLVLGDGVRQAGSQVGPDGLRFDFSHPKALTPQEIEQVERIVNREILKATPVVTHKDVLIDDAKRMGAMAIFDEKYDDRVRVLEVADFSKELCGGTHVSSLGQIGLFKIKSESSVTAGVRRIEAIAGWKYWEFANMQENLLKELSDELKCSVLDLPNRLQANRDLVKQQERKIQFLESQLVNLFVKETLANAKPIPNLTPPVQLLAVNYPTESLSAMELLLDRLKEQNTGVTLVVSEIESKAVVLCGVSATVLQTHKALSAGQIVKRVCEKLNGKGGGRPDFARGGGTEPQNIPAVLRDLPQDLTALVEGAKN